jgi:GST-like protein
VTWSGMEHPEEALAIFAVLMNERFARLDKHLADRSFMLGESFTLADVLAYPMCVLAARDFPQVGALANLRRWLGALAARPSIAEAMSWYADSSPALDKAPEAWIKRLKG